MPRGTTLLCLDVAVQAFVTDLKCIGRLIFISFGSASERSYFLRRAPAKISSLAPEWDFLQCKLF